MHQLIHHLSTNNYAHINLFFSIVNEVFVQPFAGWVAKIFKLTFPEIGCTTSELNKKKSLPDHDYIIPSWINHLSYGGLITPSNDFRNIFIRVERLFNKFTKHEVPKGLNVVSKLTNKIFYRMISYASICATLERSRLDYYDKYN